MKNVFGHFSNRHLCSSGGRDIIMKKFISLFIKDISDFKNQKTRKKMGLLGSVTGLAVNLFLAAVKILLGMLTTSVAITADGFNNLSDAGGSLVAFVTVKIAQKPYDKDHPFGHGRAEYIGALAVGLLIFVFAFELIKSSVESIIDPALPSFSVLTIILLILGIAFKLFLWRLYGFIGRNSDNPTMNAASQDSKNDVLATSAVLVTAVVCALLGAKWPWLKYMDGVVGLLVALLVLKAGFEVLRDTVDRLLGGKADKELGRAIIDKLLSYPEILGIHDFVLHDYGPGRCMASVHAEVDASSDIVEIHEVIDRAEYEIGEHMNIPICIHMDPIVRNGEKMQGIERQLTEYLAALEPPLKMHDFRMVPGENQINLIFDVLISDKGVDKQEVNRSICAYAASIDARYHCVIRFDMDYFGMD